MADRFKVQRQKSVDEIVVENRGVFKVISREAAQSLVEIINAYFGTEGGDEKPPYQNINQGRERCRKDHS